MIYIGQRFILYYILQWQSDTTRSYFRPMYDLLTSIIRLIIINHLIIRNQRTVYFDIDNRHLDSRNGTLYSQFTTLYNRCWMMARCSARFNS